MSGSGEHRFDVTGVQVLASVLATVTGAIAASYLGVAGTMIGAAVMSVASTAGGSIYKHYLGRTAGRLKDAANVAAQRAEWMTAGVRAAHRAHGEGASPDQTQPDLSPPGERGGNRDDAGHPGGAGGSRWWAAWLRRRPAWLAVAMASLGIFVGVVGGITALEAAAGQPLQAVVWHHKGTGTTVGGLVGGQPSRPTTAATHHSKPSHSASPKPTPSRTPTKPASPTPSSGSPSPAGSPSPSPTPSSPSPVSGAPRTAATSR